MGIPRESSRFQKKKENDNKNEPLFKNKRSQHTIKNNETMNRNETQGRIVIKSV